MPANANGVLYALGAFSGGLSLYVKDGVLGYEYNLFEIQRTQIKAKDKLPAGKVNIEVESRLVAPRPGSAMDVTIKVNGNVVAQGRVPMTAALMFTANDCLCGLVAPQTYVGQTASAATVRDPNIAGIDAGNVSRFRDGASAGKGTRADDECWTRFSNVRYADQASRLSRSHSWIIALLLRLRRGCFFGFLRAGF